MPNVVTFNTLVDVYGKLGRWQDAVRVIDKVYLEGLQPEARTFNTVIIAANICNQPLEALKVSFSTIYYPGQYQKQHITLPRD